MGRERRKWWYRLRQQCKHSLRRERAWHVQWTDGWGCPDPREWGKGGVRRGWGRQTWRLRESLDLGKPLKEFKGLQGHDPINILLRSLWLLWTDYFGRGRVKGCPEHFLAQSKRSASLLSKDRNSLNECIDEQGTSVGGNLVLKETLLNWKCSVSLGMQGKGRIWSF